MIQRKGGLNNNLKKYAISTAQQPITKLASHKNFLSWQQ